MEKFLVNFTPKTKQPKQDTSTKKTDKNYEEKRVRKFNPKWQIGRPWLQCSEAGMVCSYCVDHASALESHGLITSRSFLDGCQSNKSESVSWHERSKGHQFAVKCHNAAKTPETAPANVAKRQLASKCTNQQKILFRTAFSVAKQLTLSHIGN